MKFKSTILLSIVLVLALTTPASASIIDDADAFVGNVANTVLTSLKTLSLPTYNTITVKCGDGSATCTQPGENWAVSMTAMQNAQTLRLTLPSGTKAISGDIEVTTQREVTIEVKSNPPIETVPVYDPNYKYLLRNGLAYMMVQYTAPALERSGASSVITTNYNVQLLAPLGNSQVLSRSYDYRNPQPIYLRDGAGNTATITPEHQVSGGYVVNIASVVFVDDGYGNIQLFDKTNFQNYLEKVNNEIQFTVTPWSLPDTWSKFLARMKALGLQQMTDVPATKSGTNNIILTYPAGSVGTKLQAIIPKAMALSLTVIQHHGEPVLDSTDLSPTTIEVGQGYQILTVKVTNKGTEDTISVSLPNINGMSVTNVVNSLVISKDRQGTFIFYLTPTLSTSNPALPIRILVTSHGSGIQTEKTIYTNIKVPIPGETKQDMIITAYAADKVTTLSNAPIKINGQQVGTGSIRITKPLGTYTISTDNSTNPKLYSPTPIEITLSGGEPKTISLYFSSVPIVPPGEDLTWIFWLVAFAIIVAALYFSGLYRIILDMVKIFVMNPALWIPALYLIALVIVLFVLYGLYNSIMNFKLF